MTFSFVLIQNFNCKARDPSDWNCRSQNHRIQKFAINPTTFSLFGDWKFKETESSEKVRQVMQIQFSGVYEPERMNCKGRRISHVKPRKGLSVQI